MATFTKSRVIAAPAEVVFDVVTDHEHYPDFTPIRKASLEREGEQDRNGVGAIRSMAVAGPLLREEVLEYERPSRFVYRLLSGLPVKDHVGTITIESEGEGSRLNYRIDTSPKLPLFVGGIKVAIRQLMGGIANEAERRARAS